MKYVLTWWERPTGSAADYEGAQKRILAVFQHWQMPANLLSTSFWCGWASLGVMRCWRPTSPPTSTA